MEGGGPGRARAAAGRAFVPICITFRRAEQVDEFVEEVAKRAGRALGDWSGAELKPDQALMVRNIVSGFLEEWLTGEGAGEGCRELRFEDWEECEGVEVRLAGRIVCAAGAARSLAPPLDLMSVWVPLAIHPAILLRLARDQPEPVAR